MLHHTGDPEGASPQSGASLLAPGGEIAIYVYRRKAPVREFTDDYVRDRISELPYERGDGECRRHRRARQGAGGRRRRRSRCRRSTSLGIEAGEYDVQRFVYHFFMKCFWNDELDAEANAAINYDWYHPQLCSRHTLEECREWFARAGLEVTWEHVDPYGITMRGTRPAG